MKIAAFAFSSVLTTATLAGRVDGLGLPAVPADGKITITDSGWRDWPPALLHYSVEPTGF